MSQRKTNPKSEMTHFICYMDKKLKITKKKLKNKVPNVNNCRMQIAAN